jgi:hypothetical protein
MATQADLDAALAVVDGDVTQLGDAVQSIIAAVEAADVPVDLSSEVQTLQAFHAALAGDVTDIDTAESMATPTPTNASDDQPEGPDGMAIASASPDSAVEGARFSQERLPLAADGFDPNAPEREPGDTSIADAVAATPGAGMSGGSIFGGPAAPAS